MGLFKKTEVDIFNKAVTLYEKKHYEKAFKLFEESAQMGLGEAMTRLASMYEHGHGIACDIDTAIYWYTKATEQGVSDAEDALIALIVRKHSAIAMDAYHRKEFETALVHFQEAAKYGNPVSLYNCGIFYETGLGCKQSKTKAAVFYETAAKFGYQAAVERLEACLRDLRGAEDAAQETVFRQAESEQTPGEETELERLKKAADRGDIQAVYEYIRAVEDKQEQFRLAKEYMNPLKSSSLAKLCGDLYRTGDGVEKSLAEAEKMYALAREYGAGYEIYLCFGYVYYEKGEYEKALEAFELAREDDYADRFAREYVWELQEKLGKKGK